jgi:succinyl-CoA synthetase alpha subunit
MMKWIPSHSSVVERLHANASRVSVRPNAAAAAVINSLDMKIHRTGFLLFSIIELLG